MIKVSMENIRSFNLPLNTTAKITRMGESKRIVEELEDKYKIKAWVACRKWDGEYVFYRNVAYFYIPREEKEKLIKHYENYVRASWQYKFWIFLHKVSRFMRKSTE